MKRLMSFGASNFRIFKKDQDFEIAPITLLTGPNNAGKSSLFKALLLIDESSKSSNLTKLDFAQGKHKLNTFNKTLSINSRGNDKMKFTFTINNPDLLFCNQLKYELIYRPSSDNENGILDEMRVFSANDNQLIFSYSGSSHFNTSIGWFLDRINVKFISQIEEFFEARNKGTSYAGRFFQKMLNEIEKTDFFESIVKVPLQITTLPEHESSDKFNEVIQEFEKNLTSKMFLFSKYPASDSFGDLLIYSEEFNNQYHDFIALFDKKIQASFNHCMIADGPDKINSKYGNIPRFAFQWLLSANFIYLLDLIGSEVREMISFMDNINLQYINVVRSTSDRIYSDSAELFLSKLLREISTSPQLPEIEAKVNEIIQQIGFADSISFKRIDLIGTEIYLIKNKQKFNISDLGYGLSQLLPILLMLVYKSKEEPSLFDNSQTTFLIEEPESNLHPKYQSLLADLFVYIANNFNVQLLIETHSEYLIRKLQLLTAKGKIKHSDTIIHYFHDPMEIPKGEKQFKRIKINPDGRLSSSFGPGFFDESDRLMNELITGENLN
jgi:predicted ATPase